MAVANGLASAYCQGHCKHDDVEQLVCTNQMLTEFQKVSWKLLHEQDRCEIINMKYIWYYLIFRYCSAGANDDRCLWNSEVMGSKPWFNSWSNSLMIGVYPHMCSRILHSKHYRADSRFAPNQWETPLLCNVSHWLGANLESALHYHCGPKPQPEHIFNIRMPSYQHRESHCGNDMAMRRFYFLYHRGWIWPRIKLISKRSVNMAMNKSDLWHIAFRMRTHHECCECKPSE